MDDRTTTHESIYKPQVLREFEFYGGYIRVKISVKNISSLAALLDVELELKIDNKILHYDRHEPVYTEKDGKIVLGNIKPNTDRTISFYIDPLICTKEGTDINCRIHFEYADGTPDTIYMETLKIKGTCPIFHTENDINIGKLKELIKVLHSKDSKVYTIPKGVDITESLNICKNVIQRHDVRHIKTFKTADDNTYECWYYGKTKVTKEDIVIKCAIRKDTESVEIFTSGNDSKNITWLLAEIGRNITNEFEKIGKVQPVFNVVVKNSMLKWSNLLSFCDLNGICGGNVVIEDSFVDGTNVASGIKEKDKLRQGYRITVDIKSSVRKWFFGMIMIFVLILGWYYIQDPNNPKIFPSPPQKTTPLLTPNSLPSGNWIQNPANGHYYKLTPSLNWLQAETQAAEWGGHLVTINNDDENTWLVNTFGSSESFWTGYTDKDGEGYWKWISNETSTYSNWFQHSSGDWEPSDSEQKEDAAIINFIYRDLNEYGPGKWNDISGDVQMKGIVEISGIQDSSDSHVDKNPSPGIINNNLRTKTQQTNELIERWNKTFGGSDIDEFYSFKQTSDEGYILAGYTSSYGVVYGNAWLIRTDSNRIEQWNRTFAGSGSQTASGFVSVQQTSDGGYISAYQIGDIAGDDSSILIKTDSNGIGQWNRIFNLDNIESLQQTSDGGYILAGTRIRDSSGRLIKTDYNGIEQWNKTFGEETGINSVQQTSDGGYILAGYANESLLIKTDSNGIELWIKIFGTKNDTIRSVLQTTDGYILAGITERNRDISGGDTFLIKTDFNGDIEWNRTFGGPGYDDIYSIEQTLDKGYILTGYTNSNRTIFDEWTAQTPDYIKIGKISTELDQSNSIAKIINSYRADLDAWIIKTDSNGIEQWNRTFGGPGIDMFYSVQQKSDGDYLLVGTTQSYGAGNFDAWFVKINIS